MTRAAEPSMQFSRTADRRPPVRLGFLGVGWIGRNRMEALLATGQVQVVAVADPCADAADSACELAPDAARCADLSELLEEDLDGVVIATPSALHAAHAIPALERGVAVFCQKPLARTAHEARRIVDAARRADRLLGLDLSYRYTSAYQAIERLVREGRLGNLYSLDLTFHNAYGPGKPWFRNPALSGGGCLIDLGVHLVDLALHTLDWPEVVTVESALFAAGTPLRRGEAPATPSRRGPVADQELEDYATAMLRTGDGHVIRIACSWNLHAGRDAMIEFNFHGTQGGAVLRNLNGSFYDFTAEHLSGTTRTTLTDAPDAWGGRAAIAWMRRLALAPSFNPDAERFITVSQVIDGMYGR
jgi:predicted dehydrogenase